MTFGPQITVTRRSVLLTGAVAIVALGLPVPASAIERTRGESMASNILTTSDGTRIFYKDWGPRDAQPMVFHHGWPLSADDWDHQMLFFLGQGYRVIAHDRRGHGRSDQTDTGNDMDTYAADVADLTAALNLR